MSRVYDVHEEELRAQFLAIQDWWWEEIMSGKRDSELQAEYERRVTPLIRYIWASQNRFFGINTPFPE